MKRYLKSDLIRVFSSYKIYIAAIIIAIVMNMGIGDKRSDCKSILAAFQTVAISKYMIVVYVICATVYTGTLVDDLETGYIRYQIMRGELKGYVVSKSIVTFITSVITMISGVMLFIISNLIFMPITDTGCFEQVYVQYNFLYNNKFILLWFVLWGISIGVMIGVLTLFAMLTSLFITNKMFVLAMPALVYELILELSTELEKINISIFDLAWFRIDYPNNDLLEKIRGLLFTIICVIATIEIIIYKLKWRL